MPIQVLARAGGRAEILIHEPIGENWYGDGFTSKRFDADLKALGDVAEILVRINSPGGAVWDGLAIFNALKDHPARVEVVVEGVAASIASVIAMSGDTIRMGEGAMMMIHNPWTVAIGDADDMRGVAEMLDKVGESLLDVYEKRTGLARAEIRTMLDVETWLTATEAVAKGFADEAAAAETEQDEAAAALHTEHRERFARLASDFRRKTDATPLRIAAAAFQSAKADATPRKETTMPDKATASVENADLENARREGEQAAIRAETERRRQIRDAFGVFSDVHRELLDECIDDPKISADAARARLLAKLGDGVEPLASVSPGRDASEGFMEGAGKALAIRAGLEARPDRGNEYSGMTLSDLAAKALSIRGISVKGLTRDGIARRVLASQTTSDFPSLLANTAGKVLRNAYSNYPNTWQQWAAAGSVSDFKIHSRIQLGSFNNLDTIVEGGEYTYGGLKEEAESAQAVTKGKALLLTRQMVVNDDLGGFTRRAFLMGRAAARSVNTDAYAFLTGGANNHGPTSGDGGQYFNATAPSATGSGHANLTDSGTAISTASIALGRKTMRVQKDKSVRETLNILPKVLLCSATKEDIAWAVLNSTSDFGSSQANPGKKNYAADVAKLTLVTDPYLDGINSALPWYLFADPNDIAAFEVVFLDGVQTPFLDEMVDFDTDSMKFKVRLDYGIACGDWRAGYLNDGA